MPANPHLKKQPQNNHSIDSFAEDESLKGESKQSQTAVSDFVADGFAAAFGRDRSKN